MIRAAVFDVDGTLVPYGVAALSDRLRADLLELRRRGIRLFLATGRGKRDLDSTGMLRDVVFDAYLTFTGLRCYDEGGLYRNVTIRREDLENGCRVLREHPEIVAIMETDEGNFLNQVNDRVLDLFSREIHTPVYPVAPPEELLDKNVYQFVAMIPRGEEDRFLSVMPHCTYARWHPRAIDIIPKGDGKADGIRVTLERWGLRREEVMAFGDGENDISMLKLAGIGVAMGSAEGCVKAAADFVTASAEEDGISAALRRFGLLD